MAVLIKEMVEEVTERKCEHRLIVDRNIANVTARERYPLFAL